MFSLGYSATNAENGEANNVRNQLTGEWGGVPETGRKYKVRFKKFSIGY